LKITADEGVDAVIVRALRAGGWAVDWIAESLPSALDEAVLELARVNQHLLITEDKDFAGCVSGDATDGWRSPYPFARFAARCKGRTCADDACGPRR
jgi:hypothetical protein